MPVAESGAGTGNATIQLSPLTPGFGAEVCGCDVAAGVPDFLKPRLRQALLDKQILLFRNQSLDDAQHVQFARIFGPLRKMWQAAHYRCSTPYAHYLSNVDRSGHPVGVHPDHNSTFWHTDYSHVAVPARATVVHAIEVTEGSGITYFCNGYGLLETMDIATRDRLAGLQAEHNLDFRRAHRNKRLPWQWWQAQREGQSVGAQIGWWIRAFSRRRERGPVFHPIIRPHPETKRPTLFIGDHAWRIRGRFWPVGIHMMRRINAMEIPPDTVYAHRWRVGDLLVWDNASLLHRLGDYDLEAEVRIMRRSVVLNDAQPRPETPVPGIN